MSKQETYPIGVDETRKLKNKYGTWGEHPKYQVADWQAEVAANETRQGYWEWVWHQQRTK